MRRSSIALAFVFAILMTMAFPAGAADVNEKSWADACGPDQIGTYHFVLNKWVESNQTLTVVFSFDDPAAEPTGPNDYTAVTKPYKENKGTQHFEVEGAGTILSADTTGQGWLVLSDWDCGENKKYK